MVISLRNSAGDWADTIMEHVQVSFSLIMGNLEQYNLTNISLDPTTYP